MTEGRQAATGRAGSIAVSAIGVLAVAVTAAATILLTTPREHPRASGVAAHHAPRTPRPPLATVLAATPDSYLGVYERGVPRSYSAVDVFARAIGRQPNLVLSFGGWNDPFQLGFAEQARSRHAVPFIQMEPFGVGLAAIAAGRSDPYLVAYAHAVADYRYPVVIGFGHEMNGPWYPWGWTKVSPAVWVAAWRHVVTVFRRAGASNVTWIWTANVEGPGDGPLRAYWPGRSYVDWIGITGYLFFRLDTFAGTYGPTIAAVRRLSSRPILISEAAAGQVAGQAAKIPGLFSLVRKDHLLGFVWFDAAQKSGIYHQDWRLEDHPAAIAAFRRQLARTSDRLRSPARPG
jgi:mannan endo-1,4-beta-mannosidase